MTDVTKRATVSGSVTAWSLRTTVGDGQRRSSFLETSMPMYYKAGPRVDTTVHRRAIGYVELAKTERRAGMTPPHSRTAASLRSRRASASGDLMPPPCSQSRPYSGTSPRSLPSVTPDNYALLLNVQSDLRDTIRQHPSPMPGSAPAHPVQLALLAYY